MNNLQQEILLTYYALENIEKIIMKAEALITLADFLNITFKENLYLENTLFHDMVNPEQMKSIIEYIEKIQTNINDILEDIDYVKTTTEGIL